ncbi:MAG: M23 family metallopeptidase [Opitutaceae bacterium]|nr:M23 family metallopeptidase [Opitutaceae bacterium]
MLLPRFARPFFTLLIALTGFAPATRANYAEIVAAFQTVSGSSVFPVAGKSFDDIEETFGPRAQPSQAGSYDWHRGFDIDGVIGDEILNVYEGVFEKLDYSASAGNYAVIKHTLPGSVNYGTNPNRQSWTTFYTYYLHLTDTSVDYINNTKQWSKGDAISAGTVIGYMGDTGSSGGSAYAPHLHFELRFGTSNPLENQIAGDGLTGTDAWFDPHMHPLLLFNPNDATLRGDSLNTPYTQSLALQAPGTTEDALTFLYTSSVDELPAANNFLVEVLLAGTETVVLSHELDLNQRIGFDASTNALLDTRDFDNPYLAPIAFTDGQTDYQTALVVPESWLAAYLDTDHEVRVTASDVWLNSTTLTVSAVPEPAHAALVAGLLGMLWISRRRGQSANC